MRSRMSIYTLTQLAVVSICAPGTGALEGGHTGASVSAGGVAEGWVAGVGAGARARVREKQE